MWQQRQANTGGHEGKREKEDKPSGGSTLEDTPTAGGSTNYEREHRLRTLTRRS
jgi:hypothetical protein